MIHKIRQLKKQMKKTTRKIKKKRKKTNLEQSQILYSSSDKEKEKDKENDKQKESFQEKQKENEREKNKDKEKKQHPNYKKTQKRKSQKSKNKNKSKIKKKKSKNKEMEKSNMQSMQTNVVMLNLTKGRITGYMTINEYKIIHADLQLAVIDHKSGKRKTVNTSIMGEIPFILRQAQDARQYLKLALIDLNVLSQQGKREIRTVEKMGVLLNVVKKILRRLNVARNALELNNYDVFPYSQTSDIYFQQLDLTNVVIDILIENDCLLVRAHSYKVLTQGFAEDKTVGNSMIGATVNYHNKLIEVTDEIESRFFLPNIKFFRNTLAKALELIRQLTENIEVLCSGF